MPSDAKPTPRPKIDPALRLLLDESEARASEPRESGQEEPVQATFTLCTPPGQRFLSAEDTARVVERLIDDAATKSDARPAHLKVFGNLQSFAIAAPPALLRQLIACEEIASAMANKQTEDLFIRPVDTPPAGGARKKQ
ncbi:MAG: hypothetical protein O2894_07285 [Planctomycetota bacterium]|nr:hypothetical protein [Planctomycetota bacterium]